MSKRGIADSVLRLLQQGEITRASARELLLWAEHVNLYTWILTGLTAAGLERGDLYRPEAPPTKAEEEP